MTPPALSDDRGTTLVETLVTLALVVVVLGIATTALVSGQRTARATVGRVHSAEMARVALAEVARTARTTVRPGSGAALDAAEAERVVLHAHDRPVPPAATGTGPTRTTYRVDTAAATLVEERVPAPPGSWSASTSTWSYTAPVVRRVLARDLALPQPAPVFRYHEAVDPACLRTVGCVPPALPLTGGALSAADRAKVRAITIHLAVRTPEVRGGPATVLRTFVLLPNGDAAVRG